MTPKDVSWQYQRQCLVNNLQGKKEKEVLLPLTLEKRKAINQSISFPRTNEWVSKVPLRVGEPSQACSEGAAGQGAARGVGVSQRCLRQGTTGAARAGRFPADLHREGEICSLQSQKSGGFLHRGKAERAGVCNLLPAAALSPVRRWSHSLDPTRISGKQKSCCSPSPTGRRAMADGP